MNATIKLQRCKQNRRINACHLHSHDRHINVSIKLHVKKYTKKRYVFFYSRLLGKLY